MNKVFLVGRLTKAPEMRQTPNGVAVCTLNVATSRIGKRDEADFHTVIAWRGLAENCGKFLEKGQQVAVAGHVETRDYNDKNGVKRWMTEIQAEDIEFLAKAGKSEVAKPSAKPTSEFDAQSTVEDEDFPF